MEKKSLLRIVYHRLLIILNEKNRENFVSNYVEQKKPTRIQEYYKSIAKKQKEPKQLTKELNEALRIFRNTAERTHALRQQGYM